PAGLDDRFLPVGLSLAGQPEHEAQLLGLGIAIDEELQSWRQSPPART
ncbi:MAG: aspartyl-tRNA(Asn)/glutamyl-tRNA(Gln) amidotransferase subunit, partial [Kribbellaceae bacterium]|nr:aspartyl-tRNA(Asn)/glutamyl-tRNA(Gln) amidotransferase subunit [Kribbellaceae bacterium]